MTKPNRPRLLRRPEVESLTGLKRSALYLRIAAGEFPAPIRLTDTAVAWVESEVLDWVNRRISESRPKQLRACAGTFAPAADTNPTP